MLAKNPQRAVAAGLLRMVKSWCGRLDIIQGPGRLIVGLFLGIRSSEEERGNIETHVEVRNKDKKMNKKITAGVSTSELNRRVECVWQLGMT